MSKPNSSGRLPFSGRNRLCEYKTKFKLPSLRKLVSHSSNLSNSAFADFVVNHVSICSAQHRPVFTISRVGYSSKSVFTTKQIIPSEREWADIVKLSLILSFSILLTVHTWFESIWIFKWNYLNRCIWRFFSLGFSYALSEKTTVKQGYTLIRIGKSYLQITNRFLSNNETYSDGTIKDLYHPKFYC